MKASLMVTIICASVISKAFAQEKAGVLSTKNEMKQFSLLVRVPITYSPEQAKLVNPEWNKLLEKWKANGVYVLSFAFPGEGYTVSGVSKVVKKETVLADNLKIVSNIVLQTETIEQAVEFAKACPILLYDGTVEVREIPKPINTIK